MGNQVSSVEKVSCVSLQGVQEFVFDDYTVKRTSGDFEKGWVIKYKLDDDWPNNSAHFDYKENKWRIYVHNCNPIPELWRFAWRDLSRIRPTLMSEPEAALWRAAVITKLDKLESSRLDAIGKMIIG